MTHDSWWAGDHATQADGVRKAHTVIGMLLEECETVTIPVGMIAPYAGIDSIPDGWLLCNGAELSQAVYPALFAALGSQYGVASAPFTHFLIPDLSDRFILGTDDEGDTGDTGGNASTTLTTANLPAHTHGYTLRTTLQNVRGTSAGGITTAAAGTAETSSVGSATPFSNLPPYLVMRYIIRAL